MRACGSKRPKRCSRDGRALRALGDLGRALAAGAWPYAAAEASTAHVIETMVCSVGSSWMMRSSPLERMVREFQFYRRNVKVESHLARLAKRELAELGAS